MLKDSKSKLSRIRNTGIQHKLGLAAFLISLVIYFNSSTVVGYLIRILATTVVVYCAGIYPEHITGSKQSRKTIAVATIVIFIITVPSALFFIQSQSQISAAGFVDFQPRENIFTGECKLMDTGEDLPWYYQECSQENLESTCQEKAEILTEGNVSDAGEDFELGVWLALCRQNNVISNKTYFEAVE